ncbi:MAG: hypothetical protein L3J29_03460 [Cyclobacteriaceae bacterium]|nr:hypothetical protein [Cyclobacteriaceae bacterium]
MSSTKTKLTLGLLAGAAMAAFAVSKVGQNSIKQLAERTANLRNSLDKQLSDLQIFKRTDNRFI